MANRIVPKKSSVASKVPLASDLVTGELAINLVDKLIFTKDASGTVVTLGGDLSAYLTTSAAASTYQPIDADLTAIAALTGSNGFLKTNGSGTWSVDTTAYLALTGGTLSGNLTVGSNPSSNTSALNLGGYNSVGGVGYHGFLALTNTYGSATNPNKWFRLNSTGGIEIINSAYSAVIFSLSDAGKITGSTADAGFITEGVFHTARLGSGTANSTTYLRGDGTWATVSAGGLPTQTGNGGKYLTTDGTSPSWASIGAFSDAAFSLTDDADATKIAQFQLSGITTGTTRAYALPNISATLAHLGNASQQFTGVVELSNASNYIGSSTSNSNLALAGGATLSGNTKTITLGGAGASGSTTNITFGSAVSGATTNVTAYGGWSFGGTITSGLAFSGTGLKITGDFSNATLASRLMFQTSTTNGSTSIFAIPNGTSTSAAWTAFNGPDPANAGLVQLLAGSGEHQIRVGANGTGTQLPLAFYINSVKLFQIGTSGQWGIGATPDYGTAGYVFKSGGPSAAPTWSALSSSDITTALGFTPYNSTNPNGYTNNTGTVTSVGGTGTVSGLTLTGTVTSSGSLTLGGTLSVTPSNFASQTANTVLAAPNGSAGAPTFRTLVTADLPTTLQTNTYAPGATGSISNAVTAAGTTQATATALTADVNIITTAAAGTGVVMMGPTGGKYAVVVNRGANALNLYPASGHAFDGLAVNTPISIPVNGFIEMFGSSTTQWHTTYQAVTQGSYVIGAVASASTLATARTLTIGSTGKTFNGSADVSWTLTEIGAQATLVSGTNIKTVNGSSILGSGDLVISGSDSTKLPLAGGTLTGALTINTGATGGASLTITGTSTASGAQILLQGDGATTPNKYIRSKAGVFEILSSAGTVGLLSLTDAGNLTATANITAYSDETLKTNWRDLPTDFIEQLAQVKHGIYDRIDEDVTQVGVSAQSLRSVLPNAVLENGNGKLSVAYGNAAMVSVVALAQRSIAQEARIAALEARIAKLVE
jgi:hypothetical protein